VAAAWAAALDTHAASRWERARPVAAVGRTLKDLALQARVILGAASSHLVQSRTPAAAVKHNLHRGHAPAMPVKTREH